MKRELPIFNEMDFDYILKNLTPGMKKYLEREEREILDLVKPHYYVLELGCGTGRIPKILCPYVNRLSV